MFTDFNMQMGVAEGVRTEQGADIPEVRTPESGSASGVLHQLACKSFLVFRFLSEGMLVRAPINAGGTGNEGRDTFERARGGLDIFGDTWGSEPLGSSPLPSLV